jgi:fatty-acyl-CoA synthase
MNIGEWPYKRALTYPKHPFLKQDRLEISNLEFNQRVNRLANYLTGLGTTKGDRVATLMVNSCAFLEVFFACAKTGAVVVPLNFQLVAPELVRIAEDCSPDALIYSKRFAATAEEIHAIHSRIRIIQYDVNDQPVAEDFSGPSALIRADCEPKVASDIDLKDPLVIMYTSGTTGALKGAVLTHENILFGAIHSLTSYGLDRTCKSLVVTPLFHVGALAASVTPVVYAGGSLVVKDFDSPSEIIHLIMKEKINYVFAVPVMFKMMAKAPAWPQADFSHVNFFIAGGAPMPVDLIHRFQEEKGICFAQGYGMTETLRVTALDLADSQTKAGSIGKEVFHTLLRLVDSQGNDVPDGGIGEIIVKGPTIFAGYWKNPEATAKVLDQGWFHTGDLGRRDHEGFLYIEGRKSEVIICSGENIYAVEVEQAIESLEQVAEAAVIGIPDASRGEIPTAFVVLKKEAEMSAAALTAAMNGKIAKFKIPKKIKFLASLPRNSAGKVIKHELRF